MNQRKVRVEQPRQTGKFIVMIMANGTGTPVIVMPVMTVKPVPLKSMLSRMNPKNPQQRQPKAVMRNVIIMEHGING